jgi:hypothetical protein
VLGAVAAAAPMEARGLLGFRRKHLVHAVFLQSLRAH